MFFRSRHRWITLIDRRIEAAVLSGDRRLPFLVRGRRDAVFRCRHLVGGRPGRDSTVTAVVAYAIVVDVLIDGLINVRVVNDGSVDVDDSGVIAEVVTGPNAANETSAEVAKAVVDAPIKADARAPVALVPAVAGA